MMDDGVQEFFDEVDLEEAERKKELEEKKEVLRW